MPAVYELELRGSELSVSERHPLCISNKSLNLCFLACKTLFYNLLWESGVVLRNNV